MSDRMGLMGRIGAHRIPRARVLTAEAYRELIDAGGRASRRSIWACEGGVAGVRRAALPAIREGTSCPQGKRLRGTK